MLAYNAKYLRFSAKPQFFWRGERVIIADYIIVNSYHTQAPGSTQELPYITFCPSSDPFQNSPACQANYNQLLKPK